MTDLTKVVDQVRAARWDTWCRMASKLPDHHILSIELLRTQQNETLGIFTVVQGQQPVQYVLKGDAVGGNLKALVTHKAPPIKVGAFHQVEALVMAPLPPLADGGASAENIALGEPPPKQPPTPGVMALGTSLLTTTFNLGEVAMASSDRAKP